MKQQILRKALKTLDLRRLWTMWKLWMKEVINSLCKYI